MKTGFVMVLLLFSIVMQSSALFASNSSELRAEADQYYTDNNFRKAYKIYYKLAKTGDHHSQGRVAHMFANGEGKSVDLTEAYAWSVLAAQSGKEEWLDRSDMLLGQVSSKPKAEEKAAKLMRNYGQAALEEKHKKAEKRAREGTGSCTGSRVACRSK